MKEKSLEKYLSSFLDAGQKDFSPSQLTSASNNATNELHICCDQEKSSEKFNKKS